MQATCAELRAQFGGNNERFSDCWLSQDGGRSWSQQLETPPWAARWGMGMAALPSGALVLASHDVVSYVWNFHLEFAFVVFVC